MHKNKKKSSQAGSRKYKCIMLSEPLPLHMETLGMQRCASALSMAPCPLISLCGRRGHSDSKHYHANWCMWCYTESTIMGSFSDACRHIIQTRFYVISMMDQSGDTSRVTPQHTRSCELVSTSLHYSRMLMSTLASVQSVKGALEEIRGQ